MKIDDMLLSDKFFVAGHRGFKAKYPENTLLSFQEAIHLGVDMIELDIRLSRDNIMMIMHDAQIDRITTGSGPLNMYTCAELKQFDAGGKFGKAFEGLKIPTFEEVCELMQSYPEILVNVEIKSAPNALEAAGKAVKMTEKYAMTDRCVYNSFDANVLAFFHDVCQLRTHGFPAEHMHNFVPGEKGTYSKMWSVGLRMDWATPERVKEFADMGIQPWCWAPDDEVLAEYALNNGLKLATCNNPEPMLRLAGERGRR